MYKIYQCQSKSLKQYQKIEQNQVFVFSGIIQHLSIVIQIMLFQHKVFLDITPQKNKGRVLSFQLPLSLIKKFLLVFHNILFSHHLKFSLVKKTNSYSLKSFAKYLNHMGRHLFNLNISLVNTSRDASRYLSMEVTS